MWLDNLMWPLSSRVTCMWQNGTGNKREKNLWPVWDSPGTFKVPSVRQWNPAVPICSECIWEATRWFPDVIGCVKVWSTSKQTLLYWHLDLKKCKGHLCRHLKPIPKLLTELWDWSLQESWRKTQEEEEEMKFLRDLIGSSTDCTVFRLLVFMFFFLLSTAYWPIRSQPSSLAKSGVHKIVKFKADQCASIVTGV